MRGCIALTLAVLIKAIVIKPNFIAVTVTRRITIGAQARATGIWIS